MRTIRTTASLGLFASLVSTPFGAGLAAAQRTDLGSLPAVPARHAGVLDYATGTWSRGGPNAAGTPAPGIDQLGSLVVYDNTCTWTGGQRFAASQTCWERYDAGRIPSGSGPGAPPGASPCTLFCGFTFGYCTEEPAGGVRVQIGFYEGLAASGIDGLCPGNSAPSGAGGPLGQTLPKPPLNLFGPRDVYVDLSNAGLPGDPSGGGQMACWTVTIDLSNNDAGGFPWFADGDGQFDGNPARDRFTWVWEQNGTTQQFGPTGPLLAAEPIFAQPGAGTFGIPPGSDPIVGAPCGTGLGNADQFWINVDGSAVGAPFGDCPVVPPNGSGCYLVGGTGWPESPWAGLYMRMFSGGPLPPTQCLSVSNVSTYCTPKTSSIGCVPQIGATGQPQLSAGQFQVIGDQIMNFKNGLLFYGISGPAAISFPNGDILCVMPPLKRTPLQSSFGNPPPASDCSGTFQFDFFQHYVSGSDPNLSLGIEIHAQWWYRDPAAPLPEGPQAGSGRGLSNGLMWHWSP